MIDFFLPEGVDELEAELARFAARELAPKARDFEAAGAWDDATSKTFSSLGVSLLPLPEAWDGAGAGWLAAAVALEAVARGDAGGLLLADRPGPAAAAALACPDTKLAGQVVRAALERGDRAGLALGDGGTWQPGAAAPRWIWHLAGERLRLLETEGSAATPADAAAFQASGGVIVDTASARVAGEWEVDPEAALLARGRIRLWAAAVSVGVGAAALDYAMAYAKDRVVMRRPVAHHQGNAFAIAGAFGSLEAARVATRVAAHRIDTGLPQAGLWATLAYLDALDAAAEATDLAVQLLGGHGYIEDHPVEKWFREARMLAGLFGGRDGALDDAAGLVLAAPDPLLP